MPPGFSPLALQETSKQIRNAIKAIQLHSADPGDTGTANMIGVSAKTPTWSAVDSTGSFQLAKPIQFTGCGANTAVAWLSLWDSVNTNKGNHYGNVQITGDKTADSFGKYTLSSLVINGSSG